ncbi:MAG TPA: adenylosuccinate synthetase, partial [Candidatus Saccharimonadales bacterium]|nr:adenylosuccinate synthetase [Candidatus Saccharimonadales bacterium]
MKERGKVSAVFDAQRGDAGKGRVVDIYSSEVDAVARVNGGPNAGHVVVVGDTEIDLHHIPSGVLHEGVVGILGHGVFIDPVRLFQDEIPKLERLGINIEPELLKISNNARLIEPAHILWEQYIESSPDAQGSTKSGIAGVAASKAERTAITAIMATENPEKAYRIALKRLEESISRGMPFNGNKQYLIMDWLNEAKKLGPYLTDTIDYVDQLLSDGKSILGEAAQGYLLDVEQGMVPYTTSSVTTIGGLLS